MILEYKQTKYQKLGQEHHLGLDQIHDVHALDVSFVKNDNQRISININNIFPEDVDALLRLKSEGKLQNTLRVTKPIVPQKKQAEDKPNTMTTFIVEDNKIAAWKSEDLMVITTYLLEKGYDNGAVNNIIAQVNNRLFSESDKQDMYKETTQTAMDILQKYLAAMSDENTLKKLKVYTRFLDFTDDKFGHVFSLRNRLNILATNPDATFVAPMSFWHEMNRTLKPDATIYIVVYPLISSKNTTLLNDLIKKDRGQNAKYNDLSTQEKIVYTIASSITNGEYRLAIEYDVSDTILVKDRNGKNLPDKFNEEVGLANNITGILNKPASDKIDKSQYDSFNGSDVRTQVASEIMCEECKKLKLNPQYTDESLPSRKLFECLRAYYFEQAKKSNILRDINQKIYAQNASVFTEIVLGTEFHESGVNTTFDLAECAMFLNAVEKLVNFLEAGINAKLKEKAAITETYSGMTSKEQMLSLFKNFCRDNNIKIVA